MTRFEDRHIVLKTCPPAGDSDASAQLRLSTTEVTNHVVVSICTALESV